MKLIYLFLLTIFIDFVILKKESKYLKAHEEDYDIGDLDEEDLERFRKLKKIDFDTFEM